MKKFKLSILTFKKVITFTENLFPMSDRPDHRDTWEKIYDMCIKLQEKFPLHFNNPASKPLWKYFWGNPTEFFHYSTNTTYPGILRNDWVFMENEIHSLPKLPGEVITEVAQWTKGNEGLGVKLFSETHK